MAIDTAEKRRSISGITVPMMPGVTPDASQDAEWRQQAGWSYSGIAAAVGAVYLLERGMFKYVAAEWAAGLSFFFEVYHRATTGTMRARLYDKTTSAAVTGSDLSTTSATDVRQRSGALTLTDGDEYRAQFGKSGSDAGVAEDAKLVVL